jgi:LysR family transcriptional regulator, glycine cleavage system transcriptional activator
VHSEIGVGQTGHTCLSSILAVTWVNGRVADRHWDPKDRGMQKFRLPSLNALRAFEAAARHQSVKKACAELHVTGATVTRHIQKLEAVAGRPLFERTHRKIALTAEGESLYGAVTTGFSIIERAYLQLSARRDPDRLVISVDPDFAGLWLVPRLADFYSIVPNTLVEIRSQKSSLKSIDSDVSCAIHYAETGLQVDGGDMLFRSRLFPVCASSLIRSSPLSVLEDIRSHVLLHDRSIAEWEEYLRSCVPALDKDTKSGLIFSDTALCLDAAARGLGIALGDDFLAAMHLSEGRLVKPFDRDLVSKNAYYFVIPKNTRRHPSVTAFRIWLLESVERHKEDSGIG